MKTIFDHIEQVKGKPHHVRKRVAFATATALTGLIAVVWLVGSVSSGIFALKATSFADSTVQGNSLTTGSNSDTQGIAGTAAAFSGANASARIEIVDVASSNPVKRQTEQTTIPF